MKTSLKFLVPFFAAALLLGSFMLSSCSKDDNTNNNNNNGKVDPSTIATDSLVAYFPFDGNGVDKIENLTPSAQPNETYVAGRRGQCLQGAEEGYLLYDLTSTNKLSTMTKGFTLACWIKPTIVNGDPVPMLFQIGKSTDHYWGNLTWMQDRVTSGGDTAFYKLHFMANSADYWVDKGKNACAAFIPGRWSHVVFTYDGSTKAVTSYVNGVVNPDFSATNDGAGDLTFTNVDKLVIGGWLTKILDSATDVWMGWFDGNMDELRVYNAALPAARVKALYDAEVSQLTE